MQQSLLPPEEIIRVAKIKFTQHVVVFFVFTFLRYIILTAPKKKLILQKKRFAKKLVM
jgi:hypothetical protein